MNIGESIVRQIQYAARSLLRRPVMATVALLILGLGIGANTAIFSIINVVLLKPLPFHEPERLAMVWSTSSNQGLTQGFSSYPDFRDWDEQSKTFSHLGAVWMFPNGDVNLTGGIEPQRVSVARITPGFFEALGIPPLHGRTFQQEETIVGNHRRAILSYGLWRQQFGADPALVGKSVMVNGVAYTVVGVMPAELETRSVSILGTDVQLWRPLVPDDNQTGGRGSRKLRVVGRLAPSVTLTQAQAELDAIGSGLAQMYPETNRDGGIRVVPLREQVVRDVRRGLLLLLAAVAIVLLGACANVANLLLIKAASSRRQLAVQYALGASRTRLASHVLVECLLLGGAGALLGILVAYGAIQGFVALGPADIPLLADARIDRTVLAFTVVATLVSVLLVGLLPAWRSTQTDVTDVLRQGAMRGGGGNDRRLMRILSVSQIALAMVLLIAGGLLLRSFSSLLRTHPGFESAQVLTLQLELPMAATARYPNQPERDVFFGTLLQRIAALPGVQSASLASAPPLEAEPSNSALRLPGQSANEALRGNFRMVDTNYFTLLRIPILRGRAFKGTDIRSAPRAVIVSAAMARQAWGSENPLGKRIQFSEEAEAEVVGVAGDVRTAGLQTEGARTVYLASAQGTFNFMTIFVRGVQDDPTELTSPIRKLVRELDPAVPLHHVRSLNSIIAGSIAQQRFQMLLISTFSLLMFALAAVGTYGVTAYGISERTRELGIRTALGATGSDIKSLVLRESVQLALVGILIGTVGSAVLSGVMARVLFRITPLDIFTFVAVPLLLVSAVIVATLIPAHRASRVSPMTALRSE